MRAQECIRAQSIGQMPLSSVPFDSAVSSVARDPHPTQTMVFWLLGQAFGSVLGWAVGVSAAGPVAGGFFATT